MVRIPPSASTSDVKFPLESDHILFTTYLDERCTLDSSESIRLQTLHHDFLNWLALQGTPTRNLARYTRAWLRPLLLQEGCTIGTQQGWQQVTGLTIAPEAGTLPPARQGWQSVLSSGKRAPETLTNLPLRWSFADARRLPPDEVVWRSFLEDCAYGIKDDPPLRPIPGTRGRKYSRRVFVRWDVLHYAFTRWLEQQGAGSGARANFNRKWLWLQVADHNLEARRIYGTVYVLSISLHPEWDILPPSVAGAVERGRSGLRQRHTRAERYQGRLEARAKQAAGMPLTDEESAFLMEPVASPRAPAPVKLKDLPNGRLFAQFWNEQCESSYVPILASVLLPAWQEWLLARTPSEAPSARRRGAGSAAEQDKKAQLRALTRLVRAAHPDFKTFGTGPALKYTNFNLKSARDPFPHPPDSR